MKTINLKAKILPVLLIIFVISAMTISGVKAQLVYPYPILHFDTQVGCQDVIQEPYYLDFIIDMGICIKVCKNSTVEYSVEGASGSTFNWGVTGGTIISTTSNSIIVEWGTVGNGQLSVTETTVSDISSTYNVCVEIIETPTALFTSSPYNIGEDIYVCIYEDLPLIDYSISNESDILFWFWDFGDGTTSAERNPIHSWDQPGDFEVNLTVTNECFCSNSMTTTVHVKEGEPINIECPSVVCENESSMYIAEPGICSEYNWEVIGGTITYYITDKVIVIWDNPQDIINGFGYLYLDNEPCGNCGDYTLVKIPVITSAIDIKGEQFVCPDKQYTYSVPEWPATLFDWKIDYTTGTATANFATANKGKDVVLTFSGEGKVGLSVTYLNTVKGCSGSGSIEIDVHLPSTITWNENDLCLNDQETFIWQENNTNISGQWKVICPDMTLHYYNGTTLNYTFTQVGIYIISVEGNYCEPDAVTVKVLDIPETPDQITGERIVCLNRPYQYFSVNSIPETTLEWEVSGGILASSSGEETTVTWTSPSGILRLYRVSNVPPYCRSSALTLSVSEFDADNLTIAADVNNNYKPSCYQFFEVQYNGVAYTGGEDYNWEINPGTIGSVIENNHAFNPEVFLNYTTSQTNAGIELTLKKCNVNYVRNYPFIVYPVINPQVTTSASGTICSGESVSFTISNFNDYDAVQYSYDGVIHSLSNGVFSCILNNSNSISTNISITVIGIKCNIEYITTVSVMVYPEITLTTNPLGHIYHCEGTTFSDNITTTTNVSNLAYQWYYNAGLITGATQSSYTATSVGNYYVVVTDANNCSVTSNIISFFYNDCGQGNPEACHPDFATENECRLITVTATGDYDFNWLQVSSGLSLVYLSPDEHTAQYQVSQAGTYFIPVSATGSDPYCYNYCNPPVTVPVIPSCSVSFECNTTNQMVSYFQNTSSYFDPNALFTNVFYLSNNLANLANSPISIEYALLPNGATYYLQLSSTYNGITCWSEIVTFTVPEMPSADFNIELNPVCEDVPVLFTPVVTNLSDYIWVFEDGSVSKLMNTIKTFGDDDYNVTLTVEDNYGCQAKNTEVIEVHTNELSGQVSPAQSPAVCAGTPIELTCEIGGGNFPVSYVWSNNAETTLSIEVYNSGTYFVTLTDALACHAVSNPGNTIVIPYPTPQISGATEVCLNDDIRLSGYCGNDMTYSWRRVAPSVINNLSSSSLLQLMAIETGTFVYELTVIPVSNPACSTSVQVTVTVHSAPFYPQIDFSALNCEPYTIELDVVNGLGTGTYLWSNGMNGQNIYVNHGGGFSVLYTDEYGCKTESQTITVPQSPEYYFWTFPTGCYHFCPEELDKYVYGPILFPVDEQWNWEWLMNGNIVDVGYSPSYNSYGLEPPMTINTDGLYQMYLDNSYCADFSGDMEVILDECDNDKISISYDKKYCYDNTTGCITIKLYISNGNNRNLNYIIESINGYPIYPSSGIIFPGNNIVSVCMFVGYNYPIPSFECIDVNITDPYVNTNIYYQRICFYVEKCIDKSFIFDMPNDTLENSKSDYVKIFPVPIQNRCVVEYSFYEEGNFTLIIRDMLGRKINDYQIHNYGSININFSSYNNGFYFMEFRCDGVVKTVKKVVKTQ